MNADVNANVNDGLGIRIVAESGLPADVVEGIGERLAGRICRRTQWSHCTVDTEVNVLSLTPEGALLVDGERQRTGGELIVYVTELPRTRAHDTLVAHIPPAAHEPVIVSLPAVGAFTLRRHLIDVVCEVVEHLSGPGGTKDAPATRWRRTWVTQPDGDDLIDAALLARTRLVLGLVRANRPWRLIPTLSGLMAAAAATASFGVFYASIWSMADALSPARLAVITVLAITSMVVWVIVNNRLWERPGPLPVGHPRLYNAATVVTLIVAASALYCGLFVVTCLAALIIIDPGYLQDQLGHPTSVAHYLWLSWLATSMGTFAGAVGSTSDSYGDILRATYGHRERQRRTRPNNNDNDNDNDND